MMVGVLHCGNVEMRVFCILHVGVPFTPDFSGVASESSGKWQKDRRKSLLFRVMLLCFLLKVKQSTLRLNLLSNVNYNPKNSWSCMMFSNHEALQFVLTRGKVKF